MVKLIGYSDVSAGIRQYVADTELDLKDIPDCEMGSTVLVIETGAILVKSGDGKWREM